MLWRRLNPFAAPLKIPNQSDIQLRLAFCSHYRNLEELKSNPNYEYIKPPCDKYKPGDVRTKKNFIIASVKSNMKLNIFSQFALFDEIREVGYHHGTTFFTGLRKAEQAATMQYNQQHQQFNSQSQQSWNSGFKSSQATLSSSPGQNNNNKIASLSSSLNLYILALPIYTLYHKYRKISL